MSAKFTGKERDPESGLDYFGARYYTSSMGRWISPDWAEKPEAVPYSDLTNPQSLNLYGYVNNNPLSKADPDGHCPQCLVWGEQLLEEASESPAGQNVVSAIGVTVTAGLALGSNLVSDIMSNARPPFYVPGGNLTDQNGNSIFMSRKGASTNDPTATNEKAEGPVKAADAPGVTAGGQATDVHGNKLGPSGKPQINKTQSNTREAANNKAKSEGGGSVEHANPTKGNPHFHPTDAQGNKKPTSTHHEYPELIGNVMEKLWMMRSEVEVEPGDLDLDSGFTKGFMNVVTWGDSPQSAKGKLLNYLETFNWKLLGVEDSREVDLTYTYDSEVQDLIDRAKNNQNAIILGTFHSYR